MNQDTCAMFIDVQGAYDNVLWDILIQKLIDLNIPRTYIIFIYNLVSNREVHYRFNEIDCVRTVNKGLPQGCVLSPTLYRIYVTELEKIVEEESNVRIVQFADDVCLYVANKSTKKSIKDLEVMTNVIANWFDELGLSIAPNKSQLCVFNRLYPRCNLLVLIDQKAGNNCEFHC